MARGTFGRFAKEARLKAGFGLREAARRMAVSATYLSRVENDIDPASADLRVKMATLYKREIEDFNTAATRPSVAAETRGRALQLSEDLRALYRMGGDLSPDEVEDMIRYVLKKRNLSDSEIERELAQLRAELPRIRNNQGDGLFAADIKPRWLTKKGISAIAYRLLASEGLDQQTYAPPTPVELLVEKQEGITYKISDLPASKDGEPIVLGLSKWNGPLERQVVINSALADSTKDTDAHRFSFTLGHELFHAIEHLPRAGFPKAAGLRRSQLDEVIVERHPAGFRKSPAQRAVDRWTRTSKPRALFTNEDWREWQANIFSAALLMPEWSVAKLFAERAGCDFVDVSPDGNVREVAFDFAGGTLFGGTLYLKTLAEIFAVSTQAMAIRLLDLGLVREVQGQ
jgi:Zn-dependent peptidase ImmA (M78 family)/transcriptional regulator with XRE-family HTH domain